MVDMLCLVVCYDVVFWFDCKVLYSDIMSVKVGVRVRPFNQR